MKPYTNIILLAVLCALKLADMVAWSWWIVTSPAWVPVVLMATLAVTYWIVVRKYA